MFFALADLLGSHPLLHTFYLSYQCASPCKLQICVVPLSSAPFPLALVLFVMSVCFASQTPGLCSASLFGSLSPCTRFISVLCGCASLRKHRVCVVLFYSAPFPVCTRFVCYVSALRLFAQC